MSLSEAITNLENLLPTIRRKAVRVQIMKSIDQMRQELEGGQAALADATVEPLGRGLIKPIIHWSEPKAPSYLEEVIQEMENLTSSRRTIFDRDSCRMVLDFLYSLRIPEQGGAIQEAIDQIKLATPVALFNALEKLQLVVDNTRGQHLLGQPGMIVVRDSKHIDEEVIDSVRGMLIAYGEGRHMARDLRAQSAFGGHECMGVLPDWFSETYGHTSKGGFTALMYHCLTEAQVNPELFRQVPHFNGSELKAIELALEAGDKEALRRAIAIKRSTPDV
jgi:hypothetical protein